MSITKHETTSAASVIKRELRVMFSRERSPIPLRIAKWILFLAVARRLYGTKWFRVWLFGLPLAGVATHLVYRHKTRGWTRPWGGWRDVPVPPRSRTPFETSKKQEGPARR